MSPDVGVSVDVHSAPGDAVVYDGADGGCLGGEVVVYGEFGLSVIACGEAYHGVLGTFVDVSTYGIGAVARTYER
ncbi:unknown [Prevotella sp. CAG:873]|nr:unknown [Prevotella sp. CAG:873]